MKPYLAYSAASLLPPDSAAVAPPDSAAFSAWIRS
jgi:hypothetical protein